MGYAAIIIIIIIIIYMLMDIILKQIIILKLLYRRIHFYYLAVKCNIEYLLIRVEFYEIFMYTYKDTSKSH